MARMGISMGRGMDVVGLSLGGLPLRAGGRSASATALRRPRSWQEAGAWARAASSSAGPGSDAGHAAPAGTADAAQLCAAEVRKGDRHAYLAGALMPSHVRRQFYAVRYFNLELARLRDVTGANEAAASLRCQWWREFLGEAFAAAKEDPSLHTATIAQSQYGPRGHPVFYELTHAIRQSKLTRRWLDRMIDARQDDAITEQPASLADMEKYAESTASSMLYLSLEMFGVRETNADHAASHAGKAIGLANTLNGLPYLLASGQIPLPQDLMTKHGLRTRSFQRLAMMAGVGMGQQDKLNAGQGPQSIEEDEELVRAYQALTETVYDVAATAHGHLEHAREMREAIPPAALPAFQVTVPASIFLERLQSTAEFDIFNANLRNDPFSPLRVQYHIFKNSFLKTF